MDSQTVTSEKFTINEVLLVKIQEIIEKYNHKTLYNIRILIKESNALVEGTEGGEDGDDSPPEDYHDDGTTLADSTTLAEIEPQDQSFIQELTTLDYRLKHH